MISHYMIKVLRRCNGDPMVMRELAPDLYQSALDALEKDGLVENVKAFRLTEKGHLELAAEAEREAAKHEQQVTDARLSRLQVQQVFLDLVIIGVAIWILVHQ